jgi:hypothetical protein
MNNSVTTIIPGIHADSAFAASMAFRIIGIGAKVSLHKFVSGKDVLRDRVSESAVSFC